MRWIVGISVAVAVWMSIGVGTGLAAQWRLQHVAVPTGAKNMFFRGVSCRTTRACTAVGHYASAGADVTLAERWDGTSWIVQSTPGPGGADASRLFGVSCPSLSSCTAVGYSTQSATDSTLVERWNGTAWTIRRTPNPSGAASSNLFGISCSSGTACTAVGHSVDATGHDASLAERWDGASWSIQPTPNPLGAADSDLWGVSCTSDTVCTAVGSSSLGTLVERWDGTSWSITASPSPTASSALRDVSCTSTVRCTAVGGKGGSTGNKTLAERWDGMSWKTQSTPASADSLLLGASCVSNTVCTGVGMTFDSGYKPLAEQWSAKTWTAQPTPVPVNAASSSLADVSCRSTTSCIAVGFFFPKTGAFAHALVERYS